MFQFSLHHESGLAYPAGESNYRPISKLPFISKVIEKAVAKQLLKVVNENIFEKCQSGFRADHGTETALLQVTNDLLIAEDAEECSVLILLDLTAAFDIVVHTIFINKLKTWVEVLGRVLDWFASYLSNR